MKLLNIVLVMLLAGLVGCASTPESKFYLLAPTSAGTKDVPAQQESGCVSIGIGPVELPEYVNRPQIVTRTGENEMIFADYDRWAEPVADTFPRVLAKDISQLICTKNIVFFPWMPSRAPDYSVDLKVYRLDGTLGKGAELEVWWTLATGPARKPVMSKKSVFSESVKGEDYSSLVQAQSRMVGSLSKEIADAITRSASGEEK
jgi:uncharacterized protein